MHAYRYVNINHKNICKQLFQAMESNNSPLEEIFNHSHATVGQMDINSLSYILHIRNTKNEINFALLRLCGKTDTCWCIFVWIWLYNENAKR